MPGRRPCPCSASGQYGSPVELESCYENFIGGQWIAPINGEYSMIANARPKSKDLLSTERRTSGPDADRKSA